MPQIQLTNKNILGCLIRSVIGVISRRTSDSYAKVLIHGVVNDLSNVYDFFKYVEILDEKYSEVFDVVKIDDEINKINLNYLGEGSANFMKTITKKMGKNAGYYFIKEIKEDIPTDYEKTIKEIGIDLDYLQTKFITEMKDSFLYSMKNSDVLKYTITVFFETLDKAFGRNEAYKILNDFVIRLSTSQKILKHVKINDVRSIQGLDIVSIEKDVDFADPKEVGSAIQKIIQEINFFYEDKNFSFTDKIKDYLNADYIHKLNQIGVNIDIIKLSPALIVKHVLEALVNVLSEHSTQSYAVLIVNNTLRKYDEKFEFIKQINIDSLKFSEGLDSVNLPDSINSVRISELGRALQKTIEQISTSLGEEAGKHFIEKFKNYLGRAYVLRIEEIGVNLHMIELRNTLM